MEMQKAQKMKQILPLTNGLFGHMNYTFRAEVTKANLDIQFLANYGQRNPSPIVEMIQSDYGQVLSDSELTTLAGVILEMYKEKWDKLGAIYDIEYDPIHNYLDQWSEDLDESRNGSSSGSSLENTTYGHQISDSIMRRDETHETRLVTEDNTRTRTDDLTKTETRNLENEETRTDNLTERTTYGKTDTRTDNLEEEVTYGKTDTRTDNLTEEVTYGKSNQRTDNLTHGISGSEVTTPNTTEGTDVYAFNSSTGLNSQDVHTTGTSTLSYNNRQNTDTGTQTDTLSGKDTTKDTGTQATVLSGSDTTENTGTQSVASSGSDSTVNTGTRTTVNENTGTITTADEGTETTVDDKSQSLAGDTSYTRNISDVTGHSGIDSVSSTKSGTETLAIDKDRSGRHFGNIGNLTSQKQILEEINLWKWNYVKDILSDVKEFCTLPVYLNATEWRLVNQ